MINQILTNIGTTAVVVGIAGYLAKLWIERLVARSDKRYAHNLDISRQQLQRDFSQELSKTQLQESFLHKKRIEIIEQLYTQALEADFSLRNFMVSWWANSNQEHSDESPENTISDTMPESSRGKRQVEFLDHYLKINSLVYKNAIYLDEAFIKSINDSYEPMYNVVINLNLDDLPEFPSEYDQIIRGQKGPRLEMVQLFRKNLGVIPN